MSFPASLYYPLVLLFPGVVAAYVAGYAWKRRHTPAAAPFAVSMAAVSLWSFAYACELASSNLAHQLLWTRIEYFGVCAIPLSWLVFSLHYSGLQRQLSLARLLWLAVVPLVALVAVWTSGYHHLFYVSIEPYALGDLTTWTAVKGPLYWLHIGYSWVLVLAGMLVILRTLLRSTGPYRSQSLAILIGAMAPWLTNIIYIRGLSPIPGLDLTPFGFTLTGVVVLWALFRLRFLDLIPVARDAIFDAMTDGVIVVDERGRIADLNVAAEQILRCDPKAVLGAPVSELLPDWPQVMARRNEDPPAYFKTQRDERHYELSLAPLRPYRGDDQSHILFIRDTTAREQAQQALRITEISYRELFDTVGEAIYLQDREGRFLDVNRGAERMYGYPREFFIGKTPEVLAAPGKNDLDKLRQRLDRAFAGEDLRFEFWGLRSNGDIFPKEVRLYKGAYLGQDVLVALAVDITERKRTEEALREASERFEAVIQNTPMVAIQGFDRQGRIQHWNRASEKLHGYSAAEAVGQRIQNLILSPDDAEEFLERLRLIWTGQEEVLRQEWRTRTRSGAMRLVYSAMFPVRRGTEVTEVFCMDVDITERKRVEDTQRLAAVGQLAAGVAHEFNNLLSAMLLRAEMTADADLPEARDLVNVVLRSSRRGAEICSNLMAFARPQMLKREPVAIAEPIEAALTVARRQLENAQIQVERDYQDGVARVYGDLGQLEQVFLNLIINACHAMNTPTVPLTRRLLRVTTAVLTTESEAPEVTVEVTDRGVGIPSDHLGRVFEPFFTTRSPQIDGDNRGAGLGLSVSHGIITAHDGTMDVDSEPGKGATFRIRLPLYTQSGPAPAEPEPVTEKPPADHVQGTILVAEDEPDVRRSIEQALVADGHRVTLAQTTEQALEALGQQRFDAVVSDLMMPGPGGSEVLRQARSIHPPPATIVITGKLDPDLDEELKALGVDVCLPKPFSIQQLKQALDSLLSSDRETRE